MSRLSENLSGSINPLLVCCFLCFSAGLSAQVSVSGTVTNTQKEIVWASVILKDTSGKTLTFAYTDGAGKYALQAPETGSFVLSVQALGHDPEQIEVLLDGSSRQLQRDVILTPSPISLDEVEVSASRPITIKNDTIIFDAGAFLQGDEQVAEDLLRKIPGLQVLPDGTIRVGNQEVEKVMVDGDDFFDKGYRLLTRNMPVRPIDKVELYQRYSNNKHLKGIEHSEKVALNITLKEDETRRLWFGNILAGYGQGPENRHEAKANLMNFGKKDKYYFLTNLNNTGFDAVGDINHLIRPFRLDEPYSIGDDQSAHTLLALGNILPNLPPRRASLNHAEMLSLNSIFTLSDKWKVKALGFLHWDENDFFRNSFQSFSVGNTAFENTEDFRGRRNQHTGFWKLDMTYDISPAKTLEYSGKYNSTREINSSDLVFNGDLFQERLQNDNRLFDQKMVYSNKFRENKVFLLTLRYIQEKTPQDYSAEPFLFAGLFGGDADRTAQYSQNAMQFAGVEGHLLEKKGNGDLWELKAGSQIRTDNLDTRFQFLLDSNRFSLPEGYQNQLTFTVQDWYVSSKYRKELGRISFLAQSEVRQWFNQLAYPGNNQKQGRFVLIPKVGLDWKINARHALLASYAYNTTNTGVLDLFPGYIQTGFRSFSRGLEAFNQLHASNMVMHYSYGDWGDKFLANMVILYAKHHDFFSANSLVFQEFEVFEKILIKDRDFLTVSGNMDRYFKAIKSNLKMTLGVSRTIFKNIVNGSNLREVKNVGLKYGMELRSGFTGVLNYHLGTTWNFRQVRVGGIANAFTDNEAFADLVFRVNERMNIHLQTERYYFGNLPKGNNQYYFMDLTARYTVKKNKLTLFLSGNNLFNTRTFRDFSISDIQVARTAYRLQPRYLMLKLEAGF